MTTDALPLAALLRKHGLHLKKGLGQNFLVDTVHLARIVAAAELSPDDTVLEVGPGVGTLTVQLAAQAGHVVAVELDADLLPALRETLAGHDNVTIVHGDILKLDPVELLMVNSQRSMANDKWMLADGDQPVDKKAQPLNTPALTIDNSRLTVGHYKVVANLPYYITSAIIRHLLTARVRPALLVLTVQREVAQRIVAQPPQMSLLAVSVQFYARPEIVARIPAGAFVPPPKVDSAILRLLPRPQPPFSGPDEEAFFAMARAGFGQPRKQLRNALRAGLGWSPDRVQALLAAAAIAPDRRAETLSLVEWGRLAQVFGQQSTVPTAPAPKA